MQKTPKDLAEALVAAERHGIRQQTGSLSFFENGHTYACALGAIAMEILGWKTSEVWDQLYHAGIYGKLQEELPVLNTRVSYGDGVSDIASVIEMLNDSRHLSFSEIAEWLRSLPEEGDGKEE